MRLHTKIIFLISAIALSVGGLSSYIAGRMMHRELETELEKKGAVLAATIAEIITPHVMDRELLPTQDALRDVLFRAQDVEYIYVTGFDGALFVHTFERGFPAELLPSLKRKLCATTPSFTRYITDKGPVLDTSYCLIKGMRGCIHIGINKRHVHDHIGRMYRQIITVTFGIVLLSILVGTVISRRIALPLSRLALSLEAFGKGRPGEEIIVTTGGREVSQLAQSFNRMIIDRAKAEQTLRESEERYRLLFESNPHPMWVYDLESLAFLAVNDAAVAHYGYSREEFLGMTIKDIRPRDDVPALLDNVSRVTPGLDMAGTWRHRKKDGTLIDVEITSHTLDFGGRRAEIVLASDVSERRKMQDELFRTQKIESLGVLAGGIAHDFNNLLTAIMGNISLAKMLAHPGDKTLERLNDAEAASMRARDLTMQLLTFSRGGAPVKIPVSLSKVVRDAAKFALRGSKTRCDLSIPDDLWAIEADEGQISQVIHNLVINADQAMPHGGVIRIACENVSLENNEALPLKAGRYIKIIINDEGMGIPKEHLGRIFDPYFTTKQKGSGLGLTISYSIIRRHDGHITIESELGVGTAFYIYLPATEKQAAEQPHQEEKPRPGSGRILIMDDEEMVRDVAGAILRSLGYEVEFSRDGMEALNLYREAGKNGRPFNAVIMDLTIPGGMGGKEAVGKLREIDPTARVIVSSGYSNDPIMAEFRDYGFDGVAIKPYKVQALGKAVHDALSVAGG